MDSQQVVRTLEDPTLFLWDSASVSWSPDDAVALSAWTEPEAWWQGPRDQEPTERAAALAVVRERLAKAIRPVRVGSNLRAGTLVIAVRLGPPTAEEVARTLASAEVRLRSDGGRLCVGGNGDLNPEIARHLLGQEIPDRPEFPGLAWPAGAWSLRIAALAPPQPREPRVQWCLGTHEHPALAITAVPADSDDGEADLAIPDLSAALDAWNLDEIRPGDLALGFVQRVQPTGASVRFPMRNSGVLQPAVWPDPPRPPPSRGAHGWFRFVRPRPDVVGMPGAPPTWEVAPAR